MTSTRLLPIAMALMVVVLGTPPAQPEEPAVQDVPFQTAVDELRQAEGLRRLQTDTPQSSLMQRKLEVLLGEQWTDTLEPTELAARAVADVPHWHHRHFVTSGDSLPDVLARLKKQSAFRAAVLWPEATHMAFACARGAGDRLWCIGCVMRQMVEELMGVGDWQYLFGGGMQTSLGWRGRTQYPFLRARYYKGDGDPTDSNGPGERVDVEVDHSGAFLITIPTGTLDEGDYRLILYVSGYGDPDYTIAAHTRFRVDRELRQGG